MSRPISTCRELPIWSTKHVVAGRDPAARVEVQDADRHRVEDGSVARLERRQLRVLRQRIAPRLQRFAGAVQHRHHRDALLARRDGDAKALLDLHAVGAEDWRADGPAVAPVVAGEPLEEGRPIDLAEARRDHALRGLAHEVLRRRTQEPARRRVHVGDALVRTADDHRVGQRVERDFGRSGAGIGASHENRILCGKRARRDTPRVTSKRA